MSLLEPGPKLTLIKGAAWSLATRWGIRLIGFLNTMVMARLVLPADYGIVAMAFLVVGLIHSLLDFSAATALVRKDKVSRDEVDSAWTLRAIQGLLMAAAIIVAIPVTDAYFQDPRVSMILYVFAGCVGLAGFSNIGLTLAQKQFNFSLEFKFQLYSKLLSVFVTILAGWWLRDYRALVIGIATGYIGGALLSFWVHPYRPRWNTSQIKAIWKVTRWLMLANIAGFVLRKGDELVAARIGSASEYGLYNVGSDLGQMPTGEVGPAVLRSFLPVLASMTGSSADINSTVLKTVRVVATLTIPLGFGLAAVANPATQLILGSEWTGTAPYVAAFSIVGAIYALGGPVTSLSIWARYVADLVCRRSRIHLFENASKSSAGFFPTSCTCPDRAACSFCRALDGFTPRSSMDRYSKCRSLASATPTSGYFPIVTSARAPPKRYW